MLSTFLPFRSREGYSVSDFKSGFANDLSSMIELKVSLGGSASTYLPRAASFDAFCFEKHGNADGLSKALALDWLKESMPSGNCVVNSNAAFLRGFAFYLNAIGKEAYSIPDRFMTGRDIFVPYIFTDTEMKSIFTAIDHFHYPRNPLLPLTLNAYFRLTYTCGLRPMEGRELKRSDVDLHTGEIQIVNSKRRKSRIVVMSDDMLSLMKRYIVARDAVAPDSAYLFPNFKGIPYTAAFMQKKFVGFFREVYPDIPEEFLPPVRVYDLRHRFATAVLNKWLDAGMDINSRLPYLQTYMGHNHIESTAYYIYLLPENISKSPTIAWNKMGEIFPRAELWAE